MANDTVPLGYLAAVNDLDSAAQYDWGSAILASLYHGLDTTATTGYWFYEYCEVGHPIVKEEVTGKVHIPLDHLLSISPHISPVTLHEMRQVGFIDCEQFVIGKERETYASYWAEQTSEDLQLRRGCDVRVVSLPPGGGTRTRQRGSGPRTKGGSTSRRGRDTENDSE
ncbi:hypothetical protein GIB67_023832 [Kingdonia uniflora]|uniref:Uncharacterized protein n=1 Tax=Kingdonia uniflora TaxID=39325 RepID=A0A7J7NGL5_9MAGN|nr:hypothetical protein GIB67_023832 [Kingdonia uniflora]